jgi:multiple sugar transport system substrate-binding protein
LSGFLLAVPSNLPRERSHLATEAIAWLISTESGKAYAPTMLPVAPRFAVSADPEMKAGSPVIRFIQQQAQKGLLHTAHRPDTVDFTRIEAILGDEIHAAMRKDKSDRSALASAALRINRVARDGDQSPPDASTGVPNAWGQSTASVQPAQV